MAGKDIRLATAYVQIIPSARGMKGNIEKELTPEAESAGKKSGNSFGVSFSDVAGTVIKGAGKLIAGAATAATAAATAIVSQASATAKAADNIDKMSQKIGISATAYQEWDFVMQHSGTSIDNLQAGMKTLSNVITDAAAGSDSAAEKLSAVGVSIDEIAGLSQEEQLSVIIGRLQDMGEGSARTAAATDLLGKSATDLGALLNMTSEETEAMKQQVHDLGGVLSDDAVKSGAQFQDNLQNLQTAFSGLGRNLTATFLPSINEVMEGLTGLISGDDGALEQVNNGIMGFMDTFMAAIPGIVETGGQLVEKFAQGLIDNLPVIIEGGIDLIVSLAKGIAGELPTLIGQVPEIVIEIAGALLRSIPDIIDAGVQIVKGIWDGIKSATEWLFQKIGEWVGGIYDKIKDFLGIASPSKVMRDGVGKWIPAGIAEGIMDNADVVTEAMDEIGDRMTASAVVSATVSGDVLSAPSAGRQDVYNLLATWLPRLASLKVVLDSGELVGVLDYLLGDRARRAAAV